ncbi:alpha-E domain-containing protein [Maribacter halichondriae]|uniref:alpha-E domain-containing protein n=1 Tax=Maribacter halichondriae TaxID=2980554 RepID=UPI0023596715|nr:alpha-E domain-containing protein [Maribacter sp. Hal144]
MLSRVANTMYWMNRYIERTENYARFMDVNFNLSLESPPDAEEQWKPLVVITGDWPIYESRYKTVDKERVIYFLGFDPKNPNSIYSCITQARENARSIRQEITKEVWEQINSLYFFVKEGNEKKQWTSNDPRAFFKKIKEDCQLLYGMFDATITRSDGWHFGKIGQLIERADKTSRVMDVKYHILLTTHQQVGGPLDLMQWAALLKSVSAYDMYRKKYGKLTALNISEFLILDKQFPRSILCCLIHAEKSLQEITGNTAGFSCEAEKQLGKLKSELEFISIKDIFEIGLHEYLDGFQQKLNAVSIGLYDSFFAAQAQVQMQQ